MDFRTSDNRRKVDVIVDITPLIDVVFLLLIFFMITTTFVNSPGMEVELPKASSSDNSVEPSDIVIAIDDKGDIIYNHKRVNLEELSAILESEFKRAPKSTVVVQADKDVYHGLVVDVMDAAKAAGFGKLAIATQEK